MKIFSSLVATLLAVFAFSNIAYSDPIIVRSKADFLSLVSDVVTEGFEGFPTESCFAGGSSPSSSISTPLMTVFTSPQDGGTSFLCIGTTPAGLPGPTEGSNALIAGSNTGDSWILTFSLTDAVNAVWFELTDAVERGDAFISIDGLDDILVASRGSGGVNTVFFGIITDDPFTEFSLINTGISDGWGVDQIMLAQFEANTNLVTNPGFETSETIGPSLPTTFGDWEGDTQTIVGAESGITPFEGSQMLKFLGGGTFADVWQLIDLSSFSTEIATGLVNLSASARFNRAGGGSEFFLEIQAFDGPPSSFPSRVNSTFLANNRIVMSTDLDTGSWEIIELNLTLPSNTTYVGIAISATNPFDRQYADDVMVTLTLPSIDHFLCYEAKTAEGEPKFERRDVDLEDQFGATTKTVKKPKFLCTPVVKNDEGVIDLQDSEGHLVCYEVKRLKGQDKFEKRDVQVFNQFEDEKWGRILTVKKPRILCVPSTKKDLGVVGDDNDKDKDKDDD